MQILTVMGINIGYCKDHTIDIDGGGDVYIQAEDFKPTPEVSQVPAAEVISFHLITGKYKVWDDRGDVTQEDLIFQQLA